ncbi:MAG TPA: type II toxin-antitoxin system VapC family toxin [Solirubrobacterales bacterium]|nr:type II toxin-antitoxin system VapC family toxin [Solirubrobacterales bacterium]
MRSEPDAEDFIASIDGQADCRMSAGTYVELGVVIDSGSDPLGSVKLDLMLGTEDIRIEPFTGNQARIARTAYKSFGKGSGHPARLNFGDCFSYALAMELGHPLLFKGGDFAQTDVVPALA